MGQRDFTAEGLRRAAADDRIEDWLREFLRSPGSDNAPLADQLLERNSLWVGPVELPIDELHRLAGPEGEPVLVEVDDDEWSDRVVDMEQKIRGGWEPAPLVVTFRDDQLVLEDGNHRAEAIRRAGRGTAAAVVGFEDADARQRFALQRLTKS
ncbi:hypothetical protein [Dermatobacter hominis]|uniref:hypothetical protein n=1 Tax=Dermatobacter hominis TaxID=2884263 RepID=UPI001D100CC0|nr:hypothetical protein [Dermatobacter hominis]UDY35115.1 hypothetical protein LH044_17465 [Dermatobacter hominis]